MSFSDYRMAAAWMEEKQIQARRQAERDALRRLAGQTGQRPRGWLSRQGCKLLCTVGAYLVLLGRRLQAHALPQALPLNGNMSETG
ncbi:MAG: hypothetical protein PVF47_01560 [Anaerolineae bacterium]|jgi:hypothetical protein